MSTDDKFENSAEKLGGQAKEGLGKLTGDKEVEAEGKVQQAGAEVKQKIEDAKDTARGALRGLQREGED
ncbi:CsbD family protein [Brachybacterium phenoliresistens]|uniref:CsbD-like domain-containing protein n=1 Tax=Brachybacterium phenoliresistens TaxID=396014 RepID=Z9JS24_9MICO|nr:CsbD family protein [Brachybacterium phenoliresistens]EWS80838.1 hypothetical protein BF93_01805 [Brachybacterium phenoliresistens]